MSIGLLALLDDVVVFAKVAAASLDDVAGQAAKAGTKAAAVVIDDAAVTPGYVVGFSAQRELPIIYKISIASLRNKILILLPIAIALSYFAPWSLVPLLMLGGSYLAYEGAEKVYESLVPHKAHEHEKKITGPVQTPEELEKKTVAGAIRTDFILSAEITAIALSSIESANIFSQIVVLALIGFGLTVAVYGTVALIVKLDDMGLALASNKSKSPTVQESLASLGRFLVKSMPVILMLLTVVGTAAMTWVGGSIIAHGLDTLGWHLPESLIHQGAHFVTEISPAVIEPVITWLATTVLQGIFGLIAGAVIIVLVELGSAFFKKK